MFREYISGVCFGSLLRHTREPVRGKVSFVAS